MRKLTCIMALMLIALTFNDFAYAQTNGNQHASNHKMVLPNALQWGDAPAALPKGAKVAVLDGNPASQGMFTMRIKFPAGYMIPAHWHPTPEYVTVLSGNFKMGLGDKFERGSLKAMPVGGFGVVPMKTNHFAAADEETIIQMHGMGPFEITYVNPADDPRKKTKSAVRR